MLTSLIINLKSPAKAKLPATLGRASQSLLLTLINQRDPDLARALHNDDGLRPYTVSNLVMGQRKAGSVYLEAGQVGWLRFTGLTEPVSRCLQSLAAEPPTRLEMDKHVLAVTGATLDSKQHPWAGQDSYQDLAAPFLLGGQAGIKPHIQLEFTSPTTFKSKGRHMPVPLPELVFGSLLDRWQRFAPVALHPDMRRFAEESLVLSRYELRTRGVPVKQGGLRVGFTGQATFTALNKDRYWLNMVHLLATYAFYGGVGSGTATGMGQARG